MKVQPSTAGWLVVTGALAAALVFSYCGRPDPDEGKVPAPIAKTVDSLKTTAPDFAERRDSVVKVVTIDTARARRAEAAARAAELRAESERKAADSLAALAATSADSARLWHAAYDRRTTEAANLRVSLDSAHSATASERSARLSLDGLYREAERRRKTAEEVAIPGLEAAIAKLEKPCRVVGPIPCPSRRVAFLAGAVGAVVIVSAVK